VLQIGDSIVNVGGFLRHIAFICPVYTNQENTHI
jgi:hypothetical protein